MENFRIFDLLTRYADNFDKEDALGAMENGQWVKYTTRQFIDYSNHISYGLLELGVKKEDKIALIANNRPEWNFTDMGIMQTGAINVPIYPTISEQDLVFILNDAEIKYVFVSSQEIYDKVNKIKNQVSTIKDIYSFNKINGVKNWLELVESGKQNSQKLADQLGEVKASIKDTELATLLYTSGTTGNPKGVMLSHKNIVSDLYAVRDLPPLDIDSRVLSFLPLNHVFERMLTYLYMFKGASIYYAESLETIGDNIREIQPHVFSAVPRLLEKVYDKIVAKGTDLTGVKHKLFFWALDLGLKYELNGKNGLWYELQLKIANKLIFNKWREALGGNVRAIASGGAALQPRLARVFTAAGIPVLEGYGLTETSPVISVNTLENGGTKFGTVGKVIEGVTVKIAEDGEILVKGPNVMMGYFKRPDSTAEVIDSQGWFHTGDIGIFEDGKYLKITDRKKEIFKTSGGKYIAPQIIENKLKESMFIEQVMVIGENQKFAAALIAPAFAHLSEWCKRKNIPYDSNEQIINDPQVKKRIQEEINKVNASLAQYETIKKFELLPRDWSIEKGEMTPKLSLKRKIITETNKALIDKIFKNENL
ncbi:MAG: long-chain fatty acid--CoA ligase [Bacteroidetes bacterium]|nr:long-chain fatty acid--CoA ligase [Bacteroidota bacterium]HET6244162.1 long-chain fatty acid--CoA ligase [Bacteroidia bacterium]